MLSELLVAFFAQADVGDKVSEFHNVFEFTTSGGEAFTHAFKCCINCFFTTDDWLVVLVY